MFQFSVNERCITDRHKYCKKIAAKMYSTISAEWAKDHFGLGMTINPHFTKIFANNNFYIFVHGDDLKIAPPVTHVQGSCFH